MNYIQFTSNNAEPRLIGNRIIGIALYLFVECAVRYEKESVIVRSDENSESQCSVQMSQLCTATHLGDDKFHIKCL
jgi:hypothetical protein